MTAAAKRTDTLVQPMNAHAGALWAVRRGLRVLRVTPNGKLPYRGGVNEATADEGIVNRWFADEPTLNYGIAMGGPEKLVALDCDAKHESCIEDYMGLERPPTLEFVSGTGGSHVIFRTEFDAGQRKLAGATSIDVRADGGYIVGPGSIVNGNRYRIQDNAPVAMCPPEIAARLSSRADKASDNSTPAAELDTPGAIAYAEDFARRAAPAEQGDRNSRLFRLAAALKDKGASRETALAMLLEHWCPRCDPPYEDFSEIEESVASAYNNGQRQPGCEAPELEFEDVSNVVGPKQTKSIADPLGKSAAQWIGVTPKPSRFTIDKIVPEGFVTLLAAAGGRGKSLISLQAMICVAAGVPFMGFDVAPGGAAAIFCEDEPDELHRRTKAICARLGVDFERVADNIWPASHVGRNAVLWTDKGADADRLRAIRSAVAARPGLKLLVLDGVSFMFAAPEHDRGHVTRFIVELTSIAQEHGLGVVLIHHESKTSGDDDIFAASGSTAWVNACRSVLKLGLVDKDPQKRTLLHIKSNRGPRQLPITCTVDGGGFHSLSGDRERQRALVEVLQRLMREADNLGVNLSTSSKSAKLYGPRWMADHQGRTDFTEAEFAGALSDLISFGMIDVEAYENKGKACERYKLCVSDTSPTHPLPTHPDTEPRSVGIQETS